MHKSLSSALNQKVEILEFRPLPDGTGWAWVSVRHVWAAVQEDLKRNIFSDIGIGARGATLTVRSRQGLTLRNALRWKGQFLFLTSIIPTENNDRLEIKAACCHVTDCRAEPQKRTGRNEFNRPVAIEQVPITFPGILAEEYHRNEEVDVGRINIQRRVLVTPPEISLRPGDLVFARSGGAYVIRTKSDLDTWKTEYLMERQEDI